MDKDDRDAPQNDRDDDRSQIAVTNDDLARERAQTKRENDRQDEQANRREKATLWVAVAGILIAAASTGISWFQWDLMRQQLDDAEADELRQQVNTRVLLNATTKQAQASADAAKAMADTVTETRKMADAAKTSADNSARIARSSERSVSVATNALRTSERARVSVAAVQRFASFADYPTYLAVEIKNTGRSTAINLLTTQAAGTATGSPELFPANPPWPPPATEFSRGALASGVVVMLQAPAPKLSTADIEALNAGKDHLFVYGQVSYDDIFGDAHETKYCFYYRVPLSAWVACAQHNKEN